MAHKIQAIQKYGPRIAPGQPVHTKEAIEFMTMDTGQTEGEAYQSLRNSLRMIRYFVRHGRHVYLDDFGGYWPEISLDGKISIPFRADPDLVDDVGTNFQGVIENAENIGKTVADLVALWNADPANANDPIPTS